MSKRAKKIFGQHFLKNKAIVEQILEAFDPGELPVLEIGPGMGVLSFDLYEKYGERYKAVEVDRDMIDYLKGENPFIEKHLIHKDFLKLNLQEISSQPFAVIGNFPYNISSQIIFKIIESDVEVPLIVGMFQKEMAQRLISGEGSKIYGVTSVLTALFYEGEYLFDIGPKNFAPPPKIMSGVIRLKRKNILGPGMPSYKQIKTVVKMAFGQRRKTLRNSLKPLLIEKSVDSDDAVFNLRPEQLSVRDFIALTEKLYA
ncbi:MAG: 16S rRNA (adenine(1518)-N(6)/adenine(1519)-N(6))-dimethyltransferase RsmA [Chitinophagales bacterium]